VSAQGIGEPFYIDLWKVIEEKESRLLEIDTSTVQNVCQQETDKETRNHTPGK
jgi:hypothetical protein